MNHSEPHEYRRYTGTMELERAVHTLEGIMKGIALDNKINTKEINFLYDWLDENKTRANYHPFNEIYPVVNCAMADRVID